MNQGLGIPYLKPLKMMQHNLVKLLALVVILASLTPRTACVKGQRQILGHAQARQCSTSIGGGDGSTGADQCITWSVASTVDLYDADLKLIRQVTSDSDGYFEIE